MPPTDCGDENGRPIYHVARSKEQRLQTEPTARVGDTEWGICNRYNISYHCFRKWNGFPDKAVATSIIISVGKKYIVGYEAVSRPKPSTGTQPTTTPSWPWNPFANSPKTETPTPRPPVTPTPSPPPTTTSRRLPTELRVSPPAIDYLKSWERPPMVNGRISGAVFKDTKGSKTIGYGHYVKPEEEMRWAAYDPDYGGSQELSLSQMEDLFREDVDRLAEADIRKRIRVPLRQHEYDALVDFIFHRGGGALRQSGLESYINSVPDGNFNYNTIQDQFMVYAFWFNRTTNEWEYVEGFAKRRREEIDMFRYGRYTLHA